MDPGLIKCQLILRGSTGSEKWPQLKVYGYIFNFETIKTLNNDKYCIKHVLKILIQFNCVFIIMPILIFYWAEKCLATLMEFNSGNP